MDITALCAWATSLLVPFLSYLVEPGKKAVEQVAEHIGDEAFELANKTWERIFPNIEAKPSALEAVNDVTLQPEDADSVAAFRKELRKILEQDESLARDIAALFHQAPRWQDGGVVASGKGSIAVGGDVTGSTLIAGNNNRAESKD